MLINNIPTIIAYIERERDGRRFIPLRKELRAHKISLHRWGQLKRGAPDISLTEVKSMAKILGAEPTDVIGLTDNFLLHNKCFNND